MRKITWGLLLGLGMYAVLSCTGNDSQNETVARIDREFALEAAEANLMGVRTTALIESNASSSKVKEYGLTAADYYRLATRDLLALTREKNISLPTALGVPNQQEYNRLSGLMGAKFDSAYIDWAVRSNQLAIDALNQHTATTADTGFRGWIDARISSLQQIQQKALSIQQELMKGITNE